MANKVTIVIDADGRAYIEGVEQVERKTEDSKKKMEGLTEKLKKHWLEVTAAVYAAYKTLATAWNLAEQAARYEQSRAAFKSMVEGMGHDAEAVFGRIRGLSAGLIDDKSLVESANRAMSLGIPVERLGDLMLIARAKARDMGLTTAQAFSDIATGIGRASPMILDNLGLTLKVGEANEAMARSLKKSVEELTAQEQKMAVLNATLDAGREALSRHNLEVLTTKERMEKLAASIENAKLAAGAFIVRGGLALSGVMQGAASAALFLSGGVFKVISALSALTDKLGITSGAAERWKQDSEAAFQAADDLARKAQEDLMAVFARSDELMKAYSQAGKRMEKDGETASKRIEDLNKSLRQEIEKLNDEYLKLTLTVKDYEEHRKKSLAAKGADIKLVNELAASQRKLNEAKTDAEAGEDVLAVVVATEKLNASKERQLEIETIEMSRKGASVEQIEAYVRARENQIEVEERLSRIKDEMAAREELRRLEKESPYGSAEGLGPAAGAISEYEPKLLALQDYNTRVIQEKIAVGESQAAIEERYQRLSTDYQRQQWRLRVGIAAKGAGDMANLMQNLYAATGSRNKAMFEAAKAFAIAEATISTVKAAQAAYEWGMKYGGPAAPYLAVAAAAAAVAAGMARVRQIADTRPGAATGTISASGAANPSYAGGSASAYPVPQRLEDEKKDRPIMMNVHIYGDVLNSHDELARKLYPSLRKAVADNVH